MKFVGRRAWWLVLVAHAGCGHAASRPPPTAAELCPRAACPEPTERDRPASSGVQPYAITISGGVSLGAYEAGLNWTVLELLRNAEDHTAYLEGVTGASAGSINSLLTAIRWCQSEKVSEVDENLFSDAWRNIGFDELMPADPREYALADDPRAYGPDLLMSRKKAFAPILATVKRLLTAGAGFQPCDLRLGMTVTSRDPKSLVISDLHVANQRYVIPLRVHSDGTSLEFFVDTRIQGSARKELLGNLLFLAPDHVIRDPADPKSRRFVVDPPKVLRAALASSAFPGAFGPIELSHCVLPADPRPGETRKAHDERTCSGGRVKPSSKCEALGEALFKPADKRAAVQCTQRFIDGGVFDNVPLGVAMAQLESELQARPTIDDGKRRPLRYIYMYYNNRRGVPPRGEPKRSEDEGDPVPGPLGDTFEAVGSIVSTAQEYELHNVLRYNRWNAGTSKQAYAMAQQLDPQDGAETTRWTATDVREADIRAGELITAVRAYTPGAGDQPTRRDLAERLRRLAWALEQFSLSGAAFVDVQDKVLIALGALCERLGSGCARDAIADLQADVRNNRELVLTRRFSPLTGMHVGHFGAFFDRAFRDYDYYAGVYDGLVNEAFRRCSARFEKELDEVQQAGFQGAVQQGPAADAGRAAAERAAAERAASEDPSDCRYQEFVAARAQLHIESGPAFEVTQVLWAIEHGAVPARWPDGPVGQVMEALFNKTRCNTKNGETLFSRRYCLHDVGLEPFLAELDRVGYRPQSKFLVWAKHNPSRWWMLPAAYGAERVTELAERENRGSIGFVASLAASYVEIGVDKHSDDLWVAPSSLPRRLGLVPRSLFPFFAFSMHPTRRFELGLLRGGARVPPIPVPWVGPLHFDVLGDASMRVTVRPREPSEEDNGYGLFTRGATVPHLSGSLVLRLGSPILSSLAVRSGIPVTVANLGPPSFTFEEQVNAELDVVLIGDKLRFSVGCNPLAPEPNQDCWRDFYYTFGVNDLAGLAYWTGLNPFKIDRLALPFVAPRLPLRPGLWSDGVAVETGLLRAGYQPAWIFGLWADTSIVASDHSTWNGSLALELRPPSRLGPGFARWFRSLALRGGFPLAVREDARIDEGNLELVAVITPLHLRLAVGGFPGRDEAEDRPLEHPYASIGFDPGSIPVWLFEQFAGGRRR